MTGGYYDHQLELLSETLLCDLRPGEMVVMEPEMQHRMPASWYDRYETASSGQNDHNMALQQRQYNAGQDLSPVICLDVTVFVSL